MSIEPKHESATGGSASTQAVDADARRWQTRRGTSLAIRIAVVLVPFVASFMVGRSLATAMDPPSGPLGTVLWWGIVIVGSSVALVVVDRAAKRLLPIAMLYRLALIFPDRAPSRYRVALRTGTVRQLSDRLASGGDLGDTPAEAAENLLALVAALGRHDRLTRGHSERVRAYADVIATEMGLADVDRERLHWAALVHDVGKMHVRSEILNKPGRPTDEEWQELRDHPAKAGAIVAPLRPWLGEWLDAATQHHERVDGRGYPDGLHGEQISLAGRIVAVADAYDCMTSARSYKKPLPAEQARYELTRNSGTQFDPDVVRALLGVSVGRLHLAGGPLAWLAQMPGVREAVTVSTAGSASASGAFAAVAVTAMSGLTGLVAPVDATEPIAVARQADVVESVEDGVDVAPASDGRGPAPQVTVVGPDGEMVVVAADDVEGAGVGTDTDTDSGAVGGSTTTVPAVVTGAAAGGTPAPTTTTVPKATSTTSTTTSTTSTTTSTIPNQPPVAVNDAGTMPLLFAPPKSFTVLANDHDPDGTIQTLALVSSMSGVSVVGNQIRLDSAVITVGTKSIGYRICDDDGACSTATLTVTVSL